MTESYFSHKMNEKRRLGAKSVKSLFVGQIREDHDKLMSSHGLYGDGYTNQPPIHSAFAEAIRPALQNSLGSYITKSYCENMGVDFFELFKLNSRGLRSDEFTDDHAGKRHILFAGCSNTFGVGLPEELCWPRITYETVSQDAPSSGYFNVARPGATMSEIFIQITNYIEAFGTPDIVFLMLPDAEREKLNDKDPRYAQYLTTQLYRCLAQRLDVNGSRLLVFSWDARANMDYRGKAQLKDYDPRRYMKNNFYQYSIAEREEFLYQSSKKIEDGYGIYKDFVFTAMDDMHPGIAEHKFYADFATDIYAGKVLSSTPPIMDEDGV